MMVNYKKSLPRKRNEFIINKYKSQKLSKNVLEGLILKMPAYVIAKEYGLSQNTLSRLVKKYKIKLPPSFYWKDKNYLGKDKKASFDIFLEFFKNNREEELKFYYNNFPYNSQSEIRAWVYKARKKIKDN